MFKKIAFGSVGILFLVAPLISAADPVPMTILPDDYGNGDTASSIYCPNLSITMQKGARDASTRGQVSELQAFLTDYFDLDENVVGGGYFGKLTHQYVVRFQSEHSLPAFGIAGSMTRAKIAEVCGGTTPKPVFPISVTAPNGGEQWEIGQLNTITWAPYGYNPNINPSGDIDVYLVRKCELSDRSVQCEKTGYVDIGKIMDTGKASLHTYFNLENYNNWAPPGQFNVRVVNRVTGATDISDAPFTLLPRAVDLKINGSDGPVNVSDNAAINVSWQIGHPWVTMEGGCTIAGVRATPGGYPYLAQVSGGSASATYYAYAPTPGAYTSVNITCIDGAKGLNHSDYVNIDSQGSATPASLRVTSPNGGEQFPINGDPVEINWTQEGMGSAAIALYRNDQWYSWINKTVRDKSWSSTSAGADSFRYAWDFLNPPTISDGDVGKNIFKIYITGQKADGTGYVEDKSDAPFSFVSSATSAGGLGVSLDPSSPAYQIVAGGSTGVTLGAYRFAASSEAVRLEKIGVYLMSGSTPQAYPSDINQLYFYDGSTLVGTAVFAGNSYGAVSTLSAPVIVPRDSSKVITVKADLASIGTGQPGHAGSLIQIGVITCALTGECKDGASYGTGVTAGSRINSTGTTGEPAGTRIQRSFPIIAQQGFEQALVNGTQSLLKFSVFAKDAGTIGLKEMFVNFGAQNATIGAVQLYAYTDAARTSPVAGYADGLFAGGNVGGQAGGDIHFASASPMQLPAGNSYYFDVRGNVTMTGGQSYVRTTLVGDQTQLSGMSLYSSLQGSGFIWSPNSLGGASSVSSVESSSKDWTNGYGLPGFPASGISQTRTQETTAPTPSVDIKAAGADNWDSLATIGAGTSVLISWTSQNVTSCSVTSDAPVVAWGGNWGTSNAGKASGPLQQTTIYTIQCTGTNGQQVSDSVTIKVQAAPATAGSKSFTASGTFTVPAEVTSVDVKMWGAGGQSTSAAGGGGGYTSATLAVTPGSTLDVIVGAAGGGGAGGLGGGNGGGYSGVFKGSVAAANAVLIAGGGGGGGGGSGGWQTGGAGGGLYGQASHGGAGSPTAGGVGGGCGSGGQLVGEGPCTGPMPMQPAGGGGAGWWGGGSGNSGQQWGGGGGGGSGYCGTSSTCVTLTGEGATPANASDSERPSGVGAANANGYVLIEWGNSGGQASSAKPNANLASAYEAIKSALEAILEKLKNWGR